MSGPTRGAILAAMQRINALIPALCPWPALAPTLVSVSQAGVWPSVGGGLSLKADSATACSWIS